MELLQRLEKIELSLKALDLRNKELLAENQQLREKSKQLIGELQEKDLRINNLAEKNKISKLAEGLGNGQDQSELKAQIDELIFEIDRCITLVKQ